MSAKNMVAFLSGLATFLYLLLFAESAQLMREEYGGEYDSRSIGYGYGVPYTFDTPKAWQDKYQRHDK